VQIISTSDNSRPDPVSALIHHLETGNDVLRTGAVRALAIRAPGDRRGREALLAALLDEDPDVRTDAMDALAVFATPQDADTIRQSLEGDPVREVKAAAIGLLAKLGDSPSIPILRALAASRSEDQVAWEDENDVWDDWLEIQILAIDALGAMKVQEAVADLLAIRKDEYGQNVDLPVFRALSKMGERGAGELLTIARTETGQARKRALEAFAGSDTDVLRDHLDFLLADEMAAIRRLALPLLDPADPRAYALAFTDPDPELRREALLHFAPDCPQWPIAALSDIDETVQAAALDVLTLPLAPALNDAVKANLLAWLSVSGPVLAAAAARLLPRFSPEDAADPLLDLVGDASRPLEARIAAVDAVGALGGDAVAERMTGFLANEAQQVRAMALSHLARLARSGDEAAKDAVAHAIRGELLAPEEAIVPQSGIDGSPDLAAPKFDSDERRTVRISRDGEILTADVGAESEPTVPRSTLDAIQFSQQPSQIDEAANLENSDPENAHLAEETPEESAPKRRRRRSVEGPVTVAVDLTRVALIHAADIDGEQVEAAILKACESADDILRLQAYTALLQRTDTLPVGETANDQIAAGLSDDVPAIRSVAAQMAAGRADLSAKLDPLLTDEDAMVRAIAVRSSESAGDGTDYLSDPARLVRQAALEKALSHSMPNDATNVFDTLLAAERVDTLSDAIRVSPSILECSVQRLSEQATSPKEAYVLMLALAAPDNVVAEV